MHVAPMYVLFLSPDSLVAEIWFIVNARISLEEEEWVGVGGCNLHPDVRDSLGRELPAAWRGDVRIDYLLSVKCHGPSWCSFLV